MAEAVYNAGGLGLPVVMTVVDGFVLMHATEAVLRPRRGRCGRLPPLPPAPAGVYDRWSGEGGRPGDRRLAETAIGFRLLQGVRALRP